MWVCILDLNSDVIGFSSHLAETGKEQTEKANTIKSEKWSKEWIDCKTNTWRERERSRDGERGKKSNENINAVF